MRQSISSPAKAITMEAGFQIGFRPCHGLRNLYLTTLISNGNDINTVRILAGHKDIGTTQIYFGEDEEAMKRAVGNAWEEDCVIQD